MRPRFRYRGWTIAWALAVTQAVGFGILYYAFSVFTLPMEVELGWTRAQTSGAFSLALLISGLAALPVGRLVDARGARLPMSIASAVGALLVLAWSYVDSLPALYLVQAGIGLAMAGSLYDVAFTVIAVWFRRDRIRAMLAVTVVGGLASTIFIPLATALVEGLGWRAALRVLALVLATTAVPLHAFVVRRSPAQLGLEPDGARVDPADSLEREPAMRAGDAFRSSVFWWFTAAFGLDRFAMVAIAAHSVPLLLERGYSPGLVASVAGSIGLLQVLGRVLFTPASDRARLVSLTVLIFVVRAASLLGLLLVPGVAGLWIFAGLFGLANGATTLARAGLVAETFGATSYGSISGGMTAAFALAQTVAPLAVGSLRLASGDYGLALWLLLALSMVAAFAIGRAGRALAKGRDTSSGRGRSA